MMTKEKLERINYLAKKSKREGLTKTEKLEQERLRSEYIQNLRKSFKKHITSLTVIDPLGNDVTPEKVKRLKNKNQLH